jgi:hypothetical protein
MLGITGLGRGHRVTTAVLHPHEGDVTLLAGPSPVIVNSTMGRSKTSTPSVVPCARMRSVWPRTYSEGLSPAASLIRIPTPEVSGGFLDAGLRGPDVLISPCGCSVFVARALTHSPAWQRGNDRTWARQLQHPLDRFGMVEVFLHGDDAHCALLGRTAWNDGPSFLLTPKELTAGRLHATVHR